MALFLSTYVNKVDRKGRVSVPAPYRLELAGQRFNGIIAFASFDEDYDAIEACGIDRMDALSAGVDEFNPFSDKNRAFSHALFGASSQLGFDGEGRVMLPDSLRSHAGIGEYAAFVGQGATFQIWQPDALTKYQETALRHARENSADLRLPQAQKRPE